MTSQKRQITQMESLEKHQGLQNDTKNSPVGPQKMVDQHLSMSTTVTQSTHQLFFHTLNRLFWRLGLSMLLVGIPPENSWE